MKENKCIEMQTEAFVFEGKISVKAALEERRRKIVAIYIDENKRDKDTNYIISLSHKHNVPIKRCTREEIDLLAKGKTHGGVVAVVGQRQFQSLDVKSSFYALVEGIEDPFNFAHVIRTLYAAGCKGIIMGERNWNTASEVLVKTSAGASEKIDMIISENLSETLFFLKQHNFTIVGANRKNAVSLYDYEFNTKTVLCIGGEMRGLSKQVEESCDINVFIPYLSNFKNALTSVSATSVIAFEYVRQIRCK